MICLKFLDKNGRELCNGDTVKTCIFTQSWQEEGDQGYRHQVDTVAKWDFAKINVDSDVETLGGFITPWTSIMGWSGVSFRASLCDLFGLPHTIDDEEFNECIFDYVCDQLNLDCMTLDDLEFAVEGFEIVDL